MRYSRRIVPAICTLLLTAGISTAGGPIRVSSDFESGSLGQWHLLDYTHLVCYPQVDYDRTGARSTTLWFSGRLENVLHREITIQFKGMQASQNFKASKIVPYSRYAVHMFSYDNEHWQRFSNYSYDASSNTYTIKQIFSRDTVWIAYIEPYAYSRLKTFISEIERDRSVAVESLGKSVQGRDIPLVTICDNPSKPDDDHPVVWIIARQHPWETAGNWAVEGMIEYLLSDAPGAYAIRSGITFKIIPMANPDGVYNGVTRFNAKGIDLNRHWERSDPLSSDMKNAPEIVLLKRAIARWCDSHRLDFFINIHNNAMCWTEGGAYIHFAPENKQHQATEFGEYLRDETVFDGPVEAPSRANATENVVAAEFKSLSILLEMKVGYLASVERWAAKDTHLDYGRGLAEAVGRLYKIIR